MAKYVVKFTAIGTEDGPVYRGSVVDLDPNADRTKGLLNRGAIEDQREAKKNDDDGSAGEERQPRGRRTAAQSATEKVEADKAEAGKE